MRLKNILYSLIMSHFFDIQGKHAIPCTLHLQIFIIFNCVNCCLFFRIYCWCVNDVHSKSSSSITFINLWMEDYVWNQNKLCRRQQQIETSSMKKMSKFDFMTNFQFQKVLLNMPKSLSTIEWPFFPYIVKKKLIHNVDHHFYMESLSMILMDTPWHLKGKWKIHF